MSNFFFPPNLIFLVLSFSNQGHSILKCLGYVHSQNIPSCKLPSCLLDPLNTQTPCWKLLPPFNAQILHLFGYEGMLTIFLCFVGSSSFVFFFLRLLLRYIFVKIYLITLQEEDNIFKNKGIQIPFLFNNIHLLSPFILKTLKDFLNLINNIIFILQNFKSKD